MRKVPLFRIYMREFTIKKDFKSNEEIERIEIRI
jgi:hypothetical protein